MQLYKITTKPRGLKHNLLCSRGKLLDNDWGV